MIPLYPFAGWTVAVLGLDAAGIAAGRALVVGEATVWGWDDDPARRAAAEAAGVPIHDLATANWSEPVTLVVSTAVPHGAEAPHPVVARARAVQCEVINDIELLARARPQALYLGVTGVTGSAETARLLGHLLSVTGGADVQAGGGPDAPVLALDPLDEGGAYLLDLTPADIALTLSITYHVGVLLDAADADDALARAHLFHRQTHPKAAVVGVDEPHARAVCERLAAAAEQGVVPVSATGPAPGGVWVADGVLMDAMDGEAVPVLPLAEAEGLAAMPPLPIAAAYAAARAAGVPAHAVMAALRSFS